MKRTARLYSPQQAHSVWSGLWLDVKAETMAGHRLEVVIRPEVRSLKENALLHSMLGYIAETHEWAGNKRDSETWKRLLTAAWCRATGEPVEFLPALDGMGVDIVFRRTSQLSRAECADLISFIFAWGAENDIEFPADPKQTAGTNA